jgi:hypothetical protein
MTQPIDLTGRRFGRLTVLEFSHNVAQYRHWRVRCDCGNEFTVRGSSLTSENTTQCKRCSELGRRGNQHAKKHGHSANPTPTYQSWKAMWARLDNPNNASWKYYGEKGISAPESWRDYEVFLFEMKERPPGTILDRNDPAKDYGPNNCAWRTPLEARQNQRQGRRPPEDLIGQRFGRLVAVRLSHVKDGHAHWLCQCDCGGNRIAAAHNLKRGHTRSCGCL